MGDAVIAGVFSVIIIKRHNNSQHRYLFALEQAIFIYNISFITYSVSLEEVSLTVAPVYKWRNLASGRIYKSGNVMQIAKAFKASSSWLQSPWPL